MSVHDHMAAEVKRYAHAFGRIYGLRYLWEQMATDHRPITFQLKREDMPVDEIEVVLLTLTGSPELDEPTRKGIQATVHDGAIQFLREIEEIAPGDIAVHSYRFGMN
jgi:hypothetical protein